MRKLPMAIGAVLVLLGLALIFTKGNANGKALPSFEKNWSFGAGELRDLQVQSDYPVELTFVKSTDGSNSVQLYGQGKQKLKDAVERIELTGGTLDLDLREPNRQFWDVIDLIVSRPKEEIVVALTDDSEIERLKLKLSSGSIAAKDVVVKQAIIEISSGSAKLENLTADHLNLDMKSGSIKGDVIRANTSIESSSGSIKLEHLTGPAQVRSSSGSIKIYKDDTTDLDIKASSGSVYVRMPESFAGTYDIQASSGSVRAPESKRDTKDLVKVRASSGSITIEQD